MQKKKIINYHLFVVQFLHIFSHLVRTQDIYSNSKLYQAVPGTRRGGRGGSFEKGHGLQEFLVNWKEIN